MDKPAMIDKLNEILKWEYAGLIQYTQFSFVVQGTLREVYHEFFRDNGKEALGHAHKVGDKIVALGGAPTTEIGEINVASDLRTMLENNLQLERSAVEAYTRALGAAGDDVSLRTMLETQVAAEQASVEELERILAG